MKKGFTLVELLAVIFILGIVVTIVTVAAVNIMNDANEKAFEIIKSDMEAAAREYTNAYPEVLAGLNASSPVIYITLADLQAKNLISSNLIDPRTDTAISPQTKIKIMRRGSGDISYAVFTPTIQLTGANVVLVEVGGSYTEPGFTAADSSGTNLSGSVVVAGQVNTGVAGTYILTYTVKDTDGNISDVQTRTVNVEPATVPVVDFNVNGNTTYAKRHSPIVTVTDNVAVNTSSLKYQWTTSTTAPTEASFTTVFTNGTAVNSPTNVTGGYYLWILAKDTAGNTTITRSNVFNLDSTLRLPVAVAESCFTFASGVITNYNSGCGVDIIIPSTIGGVTVTSIGNNAFQSKSLYSVVMPNTIISLGDYAFCNNYLVSVTLSSALKTIGKYAFNGSNLTSLTLPQGLTTIGSSAFLDNEITSLTIPNSVTTIGSYAFKNNRLTNLVIPNSVTSISAAFTNNQLPDDQAFIYGRNADGTPNYKVLDSYGGAKRANVVIPSTVETIGFSAFQATSLTSVTIPNSVVTISGQAFWNNQLTTVTVPNSTTTIGYEAFKNNLITSITIPTSVTLIDRSILNGNLLPDAQAFIYGRNSNGTSNTTIVSYGGATKSNVLIPSGTTVIGDFAFYDTSLTSVTIPSTITSIGNYAFYYNYIPQGSAIIKKAAGTVTIGSWAFNYNGAGRNVTITPDYIP